MKIKQKIKEETKQINEKISLLPGGKHCLLLQKNTIRDRGSTTLYTAYTFYSVYTVYTVYTVNTVDTVQTA